MKYIVCIFLLSLASCTKLDDIAYDQFTLYKKFQYLENINTDGEYWSYDSLNNINWFMILYRDGSVHYGGNETRNISQNCLTITSEVREVGWWWGFFNIENQKMQFEYVNPTSINSHSKYQVQKEEGEFINDSTYTEIVYEQPNNVKRIRKYKFRKCNNKPDSMNVILRNIGR